MNIRNWAVITFLSLTFPFSGFTQEPDIIDFNLVDVTTGEKFILSGVDNKKGIVLLFVSNDCPYSSYYIDRFKKLITTYQSRDILFLLVNAHLDSNESPSAMKNIAASWDLGVPYLADKTHELKNMLGVEKSPTAVILKTIPKGYSIYYQGKIDNNPQVESDVKEAYLTDNIKTLLANKPPAHPNTRAIGCMIR
ncbi:redoxin domain-containing protein [Fulvivirga sedimenti]|uniref:Redoxin domain-containing protein n=1 Tax=Fulvivirga sedimenti TaxID=2879465 RepID=A0A9X1HNN3_9BACT|nr:redoxin domain-containing protein [Fulvivirga sedimenti]MCA6074153.1 redoxin domain-containing protein [Fulvivirga sedimenti]